MNKFVSELIKFNKKYNNESFNVIIRRFKRNYLTSKNKRKSEWDNVLMESSETFTVEPPAYFADQPN